VPLFLSDELSHYKTVLVEAFSHFEPVPWTGSLAHPINSVRVLNDDLMYATVKKTRKNGRVVKVERTVVFGDEAAIAEHLTASPGTLINTLRGAQQFELAPVGCS
jgi:hypothetical protein